MSIYEKLYPWQKEIVDKLKHKDAYGIWLDMGLGKTPIGLAFAEVNNCSKILVISINGKATEDENVDGSWLWWSQKSSINYTIRHKGSDYFEDKPEIFITNYESLYAREATARTSVSIRYNIQKFIESCKGHKVAILIDESHKVKNLQSKQSKAIKEIKKRLERYATSVKTYLLTGTPFTTGYVDLYAQLMLLGCSMTKGEFVDRYCVKGNLPGLLGWQQPIVSYKNVDKLFKLVHQYAITIKSEDVVKLPDKIFDYHKMPYNIDFHMFTYEFEKADKINDTFIRHHLVPTKDYASMGTKKVGNPFYRNIDWPEMNWLAETSGTNWLRARQLSIGFNGNVENATWYDTTRLEAVKKFLAENEDNYLLFYNYTPELIMLYDICEELGYNIDVYCGEIKSLTFYNKFKELSEGDKLTHKKNIIIANFASGATGLNWQEYYHCILFSLPLYSEYEQGIKRLHRLGQQHNVIYHVFYQSNWLDNGMLAALEQGIQYSNAMYEADLARVNKLMSENSIE